MLQWDPEWKYTVWPSWGTAYSFSWEELPTLLADPLAAGCLDLNAQRALRVAGDCLYWLLDRAPSKSPVKGLGTLSPIAEGFGLTLEEVDHVDDSMLAEVREWFTDPERMVWFRVTGGRLKAGWQLAMMYYAALHLRMLAGKRMRSMHLVAQIEGRIGHRVNWGER